MTYQEKRQCLARIIFETDTRAGRLYDIGLIIVIILSVVIAMLDSIASIPKNIKTALFGVECCLTALFTLDYAIRLVCADRPWRYARSFFGVIDLLSVIPTYLGFLGFASRHLATIRFLRVLRIFRVLNLSSYQVELQRLRMTLAASLRRILAFLFFVLTIVVVLGALMYTIEGNRSTENDKTTAGEERIEEEGFTSIPRSIYWAIVTLTTVGYGDISPKTNLGQAVAALIMILGYSIIVIPTGIIATNVPRTVLPQDSRICPQCQGQSHDADAVFCRLCGHKLETSVSTPRRHHD